MDQPATFSSLPPELVSTICTDPSLDKEDLIALRLTSKSQGIHASATKAFSKRYFTDVLLLWNKYSLETFVQISQHPVFGPLIRRVQLSCARYEEADFEDSVQELIGYGHARDDFVEKVQQLAQRCDHDHEQYPSDRVDSILDRVFSRFTESGNSFVLAVSADEEKSLGRSKVLGPHMDSVGWWANPHATLNCLLLAADRSNLKIRKIEIDVEAASICELDGRDYVFHDWAGLKSLHSLSELTVNLWMPPDALWHRDLGMVEGLLLLAVNLKSLHIRSNVFFHNDTKFKTLAQLIKHLPLEELHLASLRMDQDIMTDILEGLGSNLRRLELSKCNITGSWKPTLLSIQQLTLKLDQLRISGTRRCWLKGSVAFEGIGNVSSGVEWLLRTREEMLEDDRSDPESEPETVFDSDDD